MRRKRALLPSVGGREDASSVSGCIFLFKDRIKIWVSKEFFFSPNNSLWNQPILTGSAGFKNKTWCAASGCDEESTREGHTAPFF
ncbi:rCG28313 [Rattus norvegicus]|uniref:RCG28313 n=1 Tax=Rattus norvegicus TaxID=10116 RepID=A6IDU8_RAT|nr:rCG28313 [Rattus norvegicus]